MRHPAAMLLVLAGCAERNEVIAVVDGAGGGGGGPGLVTVARQPLSCGEGADVAVAMIGDDDVPDVLAAGGCLSVYRGAGDGTLVPGETAAPAFDDAMAVGDVNGDGAVDVLGFGATTRVLLGDGAGAFHAAADVPAAGVGALGDVALGPALDLVMRSGSDLLEFTGDGTGAFTGPHPVALAHPIDGHALGRFGGDAHRDVIVASAGVAVLVSVGDGSFHAAQPALHVDVPEAVRAVVVIDVDGDGCDDALAYDEQRVRVLAGSCDGMLVQQTSLPLVGVVDIAVADVDGDGRLDAVAALAGGALVLVHDPAHPVPLDDVPRALAAGDLDGDGRAEVIVLTAGDVQVLAAR